MEKYIEKLVFGSRWLQVPLYVGLMVTLLALIVNVPLNVVEA